MGSNVYTKNEILQELALKGYFIDAYTLDTFFKKWKIEAIFEDEQGSEFFDKNVLATVLSNLFNAKEEEHKEQEEQKDLQPQFQPQQEIHQPVQTPQQEIQQSVQYQSQQSVYNSPQNNNLAQELKATDTPVYNAINNISLSDGTPLIQKIENDLSQNDIKMDENFNPINFDIPEQLEVSNPQSNIVENVPEEKKEVSRTSILQGAMESAGLKFENEAPQTFQVPSQEILEASDDGDFDDMSLLSESAEAQEKFREYVVSELAKKNVDLTPKSNEFKLDISERTLNMIARTMAKKIAKHVSAICSQDAKSTAKLAETEEKNKKLEQKLKELDEQNKKLRLLLAESNKNLNSYQPSIFGLYKKIPPAN